MADEKPTAAELKAAEANGYHTKSWGPPHRKVTVYACNTCPVDATDEAKIAAHVQTMGHQEV